MRSLSTLVRTRLGIAVLGIVVLGGVGAYMGAASAWHPSGLTSGSIANTSTSATSTGAIGSATTSPTDNTGGQTGNPSPTDTPAGSPTTPPVRTGQTVDLHGSVGTINTSASSFILNINGSPTTVIVNGQTSFQGSASSLQGLRSGWQAEVKGQTQSDSTFLAFLVNSDNGA